MDGGDGYKTAWMYLMLLSWTLHNGEDSKLYITCISPQVYWIHLNLGRSILNNGSAIKNLPAKQEMQETRVRSLGWEDPLEEGMATHSGLFAWEIPWAEEPGRLQSMGSQRVRHDWACKHTCVCVRVRMRTRTHTSWVIIYSVTCPCLVWDISWKTGELRKDPLRGSSLSEK